MKNQKHTANCQHCGKLLTEERQHVRARNTFSFRLYADKGFYCFWCKKVTFKTPIENFMLQFPPWVKPF